MPDAGPDDRLLVTRQGVRTAFIVSGVGMVAILVAILILATARPQGQFEALDDAQYETTLATATEDLDGFERVGEDRARLDIEHAMALVAERGVDLELYALDTPLPTDAAPADGAADAAAQAAAVDGEAVYATVCASCHQASGAGVPGAFPPLNGGHAAALATADGGRGYLVRSLLYGLQGEIVVDGMTYAGAMPAWSTLSDAEVAAVLNYVTSAWDNADALDATFEPFTPDEVAAAQGEGLAATDVVELRPTLD
ncbi:MAG: cytochrome c [Trueperaceae bacterium]|nr:cytochrome c [Trueperaceae bacterium]